ncbi:hypothetical protein N9O12_01350 [Candidatus Poseidoniaceae archaeon]|nr:hypothetical protein [Candidatus Poseidoniaceae archaeon]
MDEGIDLSFDDNYRETRDQMKDKYFSTGVDACMFAFAIGLKMNLRISKSDWIGNPLSWSDMQRLKNNYGGFSELFEYLDLDEDDKTTADLLAEYVTGGLKFIEDNFLYHDGNLSIIQEHMPDLFLDVD